MRHTEIVLVSSHLPLPDPPRGPAHLPVRSRQVRTVNFTAESEARLKRIIKATKRTGATATAGSAYSRNSGWTGCLGGIWCAASTLGHPPGGRFEECNSCGKSYRALLFSEASATTCEDHVTYSLPPTD